MTSLESRGRSSNARLKTLATIPHPRKHPFNAAAGLTSHGLVLFLVCFASLVFLHPASNPQLIWYIAPDINLPGTWTVRPSANSTSSIKVSTLIRIFSIRMACRCFEHYRSDIRGSILDWLSYQHAPVVCQSRCFRPRMAHIFDSRRERGQRFRLMFRLINRHHQHCDVDSFA